MDSTSFSNLFEDALVYASELHRDQRRKGNGYPYISHLLAVASLVIENGGDENAAIAALLHDAVEDQGGPATLSVIRQRWGDEVANIVTQCSDNEGEPKRPWRERKVDFIASIPRLSRGARIVALADKVHNIRCVLADYRACGEDVWERFNGKRDGTLWYYREALAAFQNCGSEPLVQELADAVQTLMIRAGERNGKA